MSSRNIGEDVEAVGNGNCDERAAAQEVQLVQGLPPRASAVAGDAHGCAAPSGSVDERFTPAVDVS